MITFKQKGNFSKTTSFLKKAKDADYLKILDEYGKRGVAALSSATPVDTGKTAASWDYEIRRTNRGANIYWTNSNMNDKVCIAVILQYGHGTGTGGYVAGVDYINPAMRPIFEEIADSAWREVTKE